MHEKDDRAAVQAFSPEALEQALAQRLAIRHALAVGTPAAANLLAIGALTSPLLGERSIARGDEIIALAADDAACEAIRRCGACSVPVLGAPDGQSAILLENALSPMTKAVYLCHGAGGFDLRTVRNFCNQYELWLIEDSTAALGEVYLFDGKPYYKGTVGDIGTVALPSPDGGRPAAAALTNDHTLAHLLDALRAEAGAAPTPQQIQAGLAGLANLS